MLGASPDILHRFPAEILKEGRPWQSPVFKAYQRLWSIRTGTVSAPAGNGTAASSEEGETKRYFSILPHDHSDRLKCSFFFAKRVGQTINESRYKEKRVYDWPE